MGLFWLAAASARETELRRPLCFTTGVLLLDDQESDCLGPQSRRHRRTFIAFRFDLAGPQTLQVETRQNVGAAAERGAKPLSEL